MTTKEMQDSHLDFLKKMSDATMGTLWYSRWANAYDSYVNSMIMESSSAVERRPVKAVVAGSSPASPAKEISFV